jgi:hypothetical protein
MHITFVQVEIKYNILIQLDIYFVKINFLINFNFNKLSLYYYI